MKKIFGNVQAFVTKRYDTKNVIVAWTDGACEPNPGDGGWGAVIQLNGVVQAEYSGFEEDTTNNRMEMVAVIEALERTAGMIVVRTDSQLVLLCAVGRWKRKTNTDLWQRYDAAAAGRIVCFEWWRGHVGTAGNERADYLAVSARRSGEKNGYFKSGGMGS